MFGAEGKDVEIFAEFFELRMGCDGEVEVLGGEDELSRLIGEDGDFKAFEATGKVIEFVFEVCGVEYGGG